MYPNGKQVSRPVSVGENEETAVDLGGAAALSGGGERAGDVRRRDDARPRLTVTKVALVVAAVGIVAAVTFGILELKTESDYEKEVNPSGDG